MTVVNQQHGHELEFFSFSLEEQTVALTGGMTAVCLFVNNRLDYNVIKQLARQGIQLIALRSTGYNNVNLDAAREFDVTVVRMPAYSPHAVAEQAIALILTLNRKIHQAYYRVCEGNFALNGLLGFDFNGRTVGIIGTGKIAETTLFNITAIASRQSCSNVLNRPTE